MNAPLTLDRLAEQRKAALATMRAAGTDMEKFRIASRQEAALAAQVRRLRRHRNGKDIPPTPEDATIFQRASARQEREYRRADREDAEVLLLRLWFGSVRRVVTKSIQSTCRDK